MAVKGTRDNKPQKKFRTSGAQPLSRMHPDHPACNKLGWPNTLEAPYNQKFVP